MQWYLSVVRDNYANFSGRARRTEYWMFQLVNFVIVMGVFIVSLILGVAGRSTGMATLFMLLYIVYGLAIIIPSLAVSVRRLHDTGRSGWWILINFVPLIGGLWYLVLMLIGGDPGNNAYGPSPKSSVSESTARGISR